MNIEMNIVEWFSENELVNALSRIDHQNPVSRRVNQFTATGQMGPARSGQMFGLAAATVFLVMLILNAISY